MIDVHSFVPPSILSILKRIEDDGYEAVIVGGAIRDYLFGRNINDWDVATSARPEQVQKIFSHTIPTGLRHGTITIIEAGEICEVTSYRKEKHYNNGRHPELVEYTKSLYEDLSRRDYTINSIALYRDGRLFDPFDGRIDIQNKILRTVGNPQQRLAEDALRHLRAFRLAADYDLEIESMTWQAMCQNAHMTSCLSRERMNQELLRFAKCDWTAWAPKLGAGLWLRHPLYPGLSILADGMIATREHDEHNWLQVLQSFTAKECQEIAIGLWLLRAYSATKTKPSLESLQNLQRSLGKSKHWLTSWMERLELLEELLPLSVDLFIPLLAKKLIIKEKNHKDAHILLALLAMQKDLSVHPLLLKYQTHLKTLPIEHIRDLAVRGSDIALHLALSGPLIGQALFMAQNAVIEGRVDNKKPIILDWLKKQMEENNDLEK
ncbi:hypothetical protein ACOJUR_09460 [Alicyclobacillus tolerans]|uniref:hypothetical protein n=1 Tax=Alicyclobacillus tolerans TaxID=90970 RepID=UPI003B80CB65